MLGFIPRRLISQAFILLFGVLVIGCGSGTKQVAVATESQMGVTVFHADSLAETMGEMEKAFEVKNPGITISLISGGSQELASRILKGETCDVFSPSDPLVAKNLMDNMVNGKAAASWYITFSTNEMVIITKKHHTLGIRQMSDLAKDYIKLVRVIGEKDKIADRSIEFIKQVTANEGNPDLGERIIVGTAVKVDTVPYAIQAVKEGRADAGIVYRSATVAAANELDIISFPTMVKRGEDIRNAITIPATATNNDAATRFIRFILSPEGREILKKTGQLPIVPPVREGSVPENISGDITGEGDGPK